MKTIGLVLLVLALCASALTAQRGSASSGGSARSSGGGARSTGTVVRSTPSGSTRNTGAARSTGAQARKGVQSSSQTTITQRMKPVAKTTPSAQMRKGIMRTTVTATAGTGRAVIPEYGRVSHPAWSRMWWGGGLYLGTWYGPGWYYPLAVYPGFWYWSGWAGYQFEYEQRPAGASGIKFDLGQIKVKADRKAVREAGVYLPDENGKSGYLGSVGNFLGKRLPLDPGTYDLTVVLADRRELNVSIIVQPGRVTCVALRLDQPPAQTTAQSGEPAQPKLVPAPPPSAPSK